MKVGFTQVLLARASRECEWPTGGTEQRPVFQPSWFHETKGREGFSLERQTQAGLTREHVLRFEYITEIFRGKCVWNCGAVILCFVFKSGLETQRVSCKWVRKKVTEQVKILSVPRAQDNSLVSAVKAHTIKLSRQTKWFENNTKTDFESWVLKLWSADEQHVWVRNQLLINIQISIIFVSCSSFVFFNHGALPMTGVQCTSAKCEVL